MAWKESTPLSERLLLCKLAQEGVKSLSQLALDFNISRKTAHKWVERYREQGEAGLLDHSRRPLQSPQETAPEEVAAVLALKQKYPYWGARKLHVLLSREKGEKVPSPSSVQRILKRNNQIQESPPAPKHSEVGRFQREVPNALWQMDFTAYFTLPSGQKVYPLPILDDCTRFCLSLGLYTDCSTKSALSGFREAAQPFGLPKQMLTDHGSSFGTSRKYVSAFTAMMWALDIQHIQGRVAHPQTQGKTERFNRTLQSECLHRHNYTTLEEWRSCVEEYRQLYNTVRPHESLDDATPASYYEGSPRPFAEPDRNAVMEGEGFLHRRVDAYGKISLLSHQVTVSAGLAGWRVSAKHDGEGLWMIWFLGHPLQQVSLAKQAPHKPRP